MLTNDDYRENEAPNAMMEIQVAKEGVLANPVRFRIMPMTVLEAERLGIVNFTRPADDDVSPSIAGKVQQVACVLLLIAINFFEQIQMTLMPLLLM